MDQEKIAKFIKEIRSKHNLTQKQFAARYRVTYQAVSKWENALNMPDTSLMREICKDFGISMDELLDGEYKEKKKKKRLWIILIGFFVLFLIILLLLFFPFSKAKDFQFKTLSTECHNFNLSGTISYSEKKSAIYITNIHYCGGDDLTEYKKIECVLYESKENEENKVSSFESSVEKMTLEAFLQDVTLSIDHYEKSCKEYREDSFYLLINATDFMNKVITYKIPLKLDNCSTNN